MPRNASGTYTLPAGNPVEAGTVIEAAWANSTLEDLGNEITNSLSRTGEGGMLAPFRLANGTLAAPGIAWLNEPSTGFYRAGAGEMWGVVSGSQILQYTANGILIPTTKTFTAQGNATIGGTLAVTGATTLTGALAANGGVTTTTLSTSGAATLHSGSVTNNFSVGGNLSVTGSLTLTGGILLNGNVTVGDSSSDTLTINSTITSHLLFTDNTYDIGASGATRPRNLFLAGNGTIGGTLGVTGAITATGGVVGNVTGNVTGNVSGNAGTVTNGVYTSGSYADPAWITSLAGSKITGNISGNAGNVTGTVGLANGGTAATTASGARTNLGLAIGTDIPSPTGTGASGTWGINISGNAATVTNGVYTSGSYADPAWITSLAGSKITGAINNVTIGQSTAAAGSFTTLSATTSASLTVLTSTGLTKLGASTGSESLRVAATSAAVNYVRVYGGATGSAAVIDAQGSDTNVDLSLSPKGSGALNLYGSVLVQGGTANGVAYLNGSKVLTTGSALTFDGNTLGVITSVTALTLNRTGAGTALIELKTNGTVGSFLGTEAANNFTIYNAAGGQLATFNATGLGIGTSSINGRLTLQNSSVRAEFGETGGANYIESLNNARTDSVPLRLYGLQLQVFTKPSLGGYSQNLTLDSSGNLGLGVTPSAWFSTNKAFQFGYGAVRAFSNSANTYLENNNYVNSSGTDIYLNNGAAGRYRIADNQHIWYQAASGNAGDPISFGDAKMTLDASGNLSVGTTSALYSFANRGNITVNGSSSAIFALGIGGSASGYLYTDANTVAVGSSPSKYISFDINGERGRFSTDGTFRVKGAGTAGSTDAVQFAGSAPASSLILDSDGDLGVGISSPTFRLSVKSSANIIAAFESQASSYPTGQNYNVIIGRGTNSIPHSTTTTIASGYGGGIAMITMRQTTGNDTQYTYLVTWGWNSATVLFSNFYGVTTTTSTFTASSGNLQVSHDHTTGNCDYIVGAVINGPL